MFKLFHLKNSIFVKYLISILCVAILPTVVFMYAFFNYVSDNMKRNILGNITGNIAAVSEEIDKDVVMIGNILNDYELEVKERNDIFTSIQPVEFLNDERTKEQLRFMLNRNKSIENLILINNSYNWAYASRNSKYVDPFYSFNDDSTFACLRENTAEIIVLDIHNQPYFYNAPHYVISFVKNYFIDNKYIGSMIIDIRIDYFVEMFKQIGALNVDEIKVLGRDGICLYSNRFQEIELYYVSEDIPTYDLRSAVPPKESEAIYINSKLKNINWEILAKLSHDHVYADLNRIKSTFVFSIGIIILFLFALSLFNALFMSRPIKKMMERLRLIEEGDLSVKLSEKSNDEIGMISKAVNRMTESLKQHMEREYNYQIKQKEAELDALKMQIKPHFLYNTLEIIRMSAKEENAHKASSMISALAKQLQYLLGGKNDIVSVREEMQSIYNYLELVKIRYQNKINFIDNVDEDVLDLGMQKIILQPIVENCLKHALPDNGEELNIIISGAIVSDVLELSVFDNGKGIPKERLDKIISELTDETSGSVSNIGLKSVHERIRLCFGDRFGIKVESTERAGTLIRIILPVLEVRENGG